MSKLQFSVHEFLSIMGRIDEDLNGAKPKPDSLYMEWFDQWKQMEAKAEKLAPMERADFYFDGKVTINAISEPHLRELVETVKALVNINETMFAENDPDADEEDLAMWRNRSRELSGTLASFVADGS